MFRSSVILLLLVASPITAAAQGWCQQPRKLIESIAAEVNRTATELPDGFRQGRLQLVVGQIDDQNRLSGRVIAPDGAEPSLSITISGDPYEAIAMLMSRIPPKVLAIPKPGQHIVGIAHNGFSDLISSHSNGDPDDTAQHRIYRTECDEGFVVNPTPEYVALLKQCLTEGHCNP